MSKQKKMIDLKLSIDEALVLSDLIERLDDFNVFDKEEFAEYEKQVLWNVECLLEKVLNEPFEDNYLKKLNRARRTLTPFFDIYMPKELLEKSINSNSLVYREENILEVIKYFQTKRIRISKIIVSSEKNNIEKTIIQAKGEEDFYDSSHLYTSLIEKLLQESIDKGYEFKLVL